MGMRGLKATPKKRPSETPEPSFGPHPWEAPKLSRAEKVILFLPKLCQ